MPTITQDDTETVDPASSGEDAGPRPSADVLLRWLEQEEKRAERVRSRFGRVTIISLTVVVPFLFLALTAGVSLGGWRRLTQEPPEETKARVEQATKQALLQAGGGDTVDDPVAADLHRYVTSDLPPLKMQEKKILAGYWRVVNDTYKNDRTAIRAIHEQIVPAYAQYVEHLESVRVATDDLYAVHKMKLDIAHKRKSAFDRIAHADDVEVIPAAGEGWRVEAARQLEEARNIEAAFHLRLADLGKRHPFRPHGSVPSPNPAPRGSTPPHKARKGLS